MTSNSVKPSARLYHFEFTIAWLESDATAQRMNKDGELCAIIRAQVQDGAIHQPGRKKLRVSPTFLNDLSGSHDVFELDTRGEFPPLRKGGRAVFDEFVVVVEVCNPDFPGFEIVVQAKCLFLRRRLIVEVAHHAGEQVTGAVQPLADQYGAESGSNKQHGKADEEYDNGEFNERQPVLCPDDLSLKRRRRFPARRSRAR